MRAKFSNEVAAAGLPAGPGPSTPVVEADLDSLPEPARRYIRAMGVVDRPRDWSFRAATEGRFRTSAEAPWRECEAWQYNSRLEIARIFHIVIRLGGLLPVVARDTYVGGKGRMLVRVLDLFTVADGAGPEFDIGELVTWLNDAVFVAPSMLLGPGIAWSSADDRSFGVSLTDRGRTVTARVLLDDRGFPRDFSTSDRFYYDSKTKTATRAEWRTPIEGWQVVDGHPVPVRGQAVWQLPQGALPYADFHFVPGSIAFNVRPGE